MDSDIQYLPGVGPKRAALLRSELEINKIGDLIRLYPFRYIDRSTVTPIGSVVPDAAFVQIQATVVSSEFSGKKLQYFDSELNESYTPYVIETSIGVDRTFLAIFSYALKDETLEDGTIRTVLSLPARLAPYKAAVLPLVKKDGLPEKAREIQHLLMPDMMVQYDEKDAIGRRYRRQDAIGTPFCITVDNDTLTDNAVTVRHRDTMQQERIAIDQLPGYLKAKL